MKRWLLRHGDRGGCGENHGHRFGKLCGVSQPLQPQVGEIWGRLGVAWGTRGSGCSTRLRSLTPQVEGGPGSVELDRVA